MIDITQAYDKSFTAQDLDLAIRTVWAEARGEGEMGMEAVAWVIRNRSEVDLWEDGKPDWWGETLTEVVLRRWQFSCWNYNDPNRDKAIKLRRSSDGYDNAMRAMVKVLLSNKSDDPTGGACHYHTKGLSPKWARGREPDYISGNHLFYRGIK